MANVPVAWSGAETGDFGLEANNAGGTQSIVTTGPQSGAREYKCNPTGIAVGWISFAQFSATTGKQVSLNTSGTVFASFFYNPATIPTGTEIAGGFYTGLVVTTPVATLRITSGGLLAVYDSTGTLVATGTTALTANGGTHPGNKYRIDFSANRTTGAYQVSIEGVSELSGSGASFGATNIGNFTIGKVTNTNGSTVDFRYDDIWVDTSAFAPGKYSMVVDVPTANGTTMSWTNSDSGTGDWTHVDNVPASTAQFVQDPSGTSLPVIAQFSMQTFAQMGIPVGSQIWGVMPTGYLKDGGAAITNTVKLGIISGATKSTNTTAQNTSASFVNYGRLITTDPNTGAAWTQSGIENMQFYVEEGTTTVITDLAAALITVVFTPPTVVTQTGKARITATTPQTQLGKSNIVSLTTQTQQGKARLTATTLKTILGLARVTVTKLQTILGKARLTATSAQTILGKANITNSVNTTKTQPGKARITATTTQAQLGKSRITAAATKSIQGVARLTVTTLKTVLGRARIALLTAKTITGKARITAASIQNQLGKADIKKTTIQTQLGVSRIALLTTRTQPGKAKISVVTAKAIQGKASILVPATLGASSKIVLYDEPKLVSLADNPSTIALGGSGHAVNLSQK